MYLVASNNWMVTLLLKTKKTRLISLVLSTATQEVTMLLKNRTESFKSFLVAVTKSKADKNFRVGRSFFQCSASAFEELKKLCLTAAENWLLKNFPFIISKFLHLS